MVAGAAEEARVSAGERAARTDAKLGVIPGRRQDAAPTPSTPAVTANVAGGTWLDRLKRLAVQALRVDPIRARVARARFIYYVKLLKRLRTFDQNSDGITANTIAHNVKGMVDLTV